MKKFISAVTSLAMAATMASSIAPSISAADATKTFSLKAYAEAGSKYDAMGDKVTISKDDIAAGDVTVPCAVYLDEATNDSETISVQFTVNSKSADVKNVKFTAFGPSDNYFDSAKEVTVAGETVSTKKFLAFAGGIDPILESYKAAGSEIIGCDPSQEAAGTSNYFIGYSWTNQGKSYKWTGEKSSDHPVMVFNVTFPKGTAAGDYKIEYCKYNTDATGEHNNPSNMIETSTRYTEEAKNLVLNDMTITVEGDNATSDTTTQKPDDTTTTKKPDDTTTTTTTTNKPDDTTTTTVANPDTSKADVVFDFGNYETEAGKKVKVQVKTDSKGKGIAAMDVVFKLDSPLVYGGVAEESPAFGMSVMSNNEILGANFTAIKNGSGDPITPSADEATFVVLVNVPETTPTGTYKIGFGDKCEVFKDSTQNTYSTAAINGNIKVTNPNGGDDTTTKKPDDTTTTTTNKPDDTTTTTTAPVDTSKADVVFDFGNYKTEAGKKVKVQVKTDSKGKGIAAMDVVFKVDSPLVYGGVAEESPAFGMSVMSNPDILGANFTAIKNGSGDPITPSADEATFVIVVNVPETTPTGTYKVGFGDKCEVFKDSTQNTYSTAVINGNIEVTNPNGEVTTTTQKPDDTTTTSTSTTVSTDKKDETTTTTSTPVSGSLKPVWGDVNCDGSVNVADVVLLNKYINKNSDYAITDQGKVNADVCNPQNADNTVAVDPSKVDIDKADSEAIIRSIVHLVTLPTKA